MDIVQFYILLMIGVMALGGFAHVRNSARSQLKSARTDNSRLLWKSQPNYHGYLTAWSVGLCGLTIYTFFSFLLPGQLMLLLVVMMAVCGGVTYGLMRKVGADFRARLHVERFIRGTLLALSTIAVLTTFGIVFALLFESLRFFADVPLLDFLTGLKWSPQTALRADQAGASGAFGAIPVFAGTFLIMAVAIVIAGPVGLMIAIYLSEYASKRMRSVVKPLIEILAGIPTVVFGFFALMTVGPTIRSVAESFGFAVPTQSALSAGVVMGIMIIPLISSLSDDVINAVPQSLRDGAYALGATQSEAMKQVVFPSALPGIIAAFLLAISRAIGETMIVVMAAGRAANLTGNPFEAVTTVTVQIVALLTGDQTFDSPKTLAAFALGLVLFAITLGLNVIALRTVRRYRRAYAG